MEPQPQVRGQLSELRDVILLDGALYDCLEHSLKLKPQVNEKRILIILEYGRAQLSRLTTN